MIGYFTGAIGIIVALSIVFLIRKDRLHTSNGLGWIFVGAAFAMLGFTPSLFDELGAYLGIKYPPTLAFTLATGAIVLKLLSTDMQHSRILMRQQRLVQRLAILETEIRRIKTSSSLKGLSQNTDQAGKED